MGLFRSRLRSLWTQQRWTTGDTTPERTNEQSRRVVHRAVEGLARAAPRNDANLSHFLPRLRFEFVGKAFVRRAELYGVLVSASARE